MLTKLEVGGGRVTRSPGGWSLRLPVVHRGYADAQVDDTQGLRRVEFLHRPPTRLRLELRTTAAEPPGTLGFGFWNDPFPSTAGAAGAGRLLPASPQALWFFWRSTPSDLPFAPDASGRGWCAASLRSPPVPGIVAAALGAGAFLGMLAPAFRPAVVRRFWGVVRGQQTTLELPLDRWRDYEIDWQREAAFFRVGGDVVLVSKEPPKGPLGIVVWIDNQWAAFSEAAGLRFGVLATRDEVAFEIRNLELDGMPLPVSDGGV